MFNRETYLLNVVTVVPPFPWSLGLGRPCWSIPGPAWGHLQTIYFLPVNGDVVFCHGNCLGIHAAPEPCNGKRTLELTCGTWFGRCLSLAMVRRGVPLWLGDRDYAIWGMFVSIGIWQRVLGFQHGAVFGRSDVGYNRELYRQRRNGWGPPQGWERFFEWSHGPALGQPRFVVTISLHRALSSLCTIRGHLAPRRWAEQIRLC